MDFKIISEIFETDHETKLAVVIRHGENEQGMEGLLSKVGIMHTEAFADSLKSLKQPVRIYTSPKLRCVQSANIINNVISGGKKDIILTSKLGEPGIQILNYDIFLDLYAEKRCREIFSEWKEKQHYDALLNPVELRKKAELFFRSTCITTGITLYLSQSGTVAGLGYAFNKTDYDVQNGQWVPYLDGFFLNVND